VERAEVVVVGLGAMGSAAARALGRRGIETVALERFRVGHERGSSHGPSRIFRLSYPEPEYVRMSIRALELWRELEHDADETLLVTTGGLDVGPDAERCAASLSEAGVPHEWLDERECERRFPGIAVPGRALYQEDAGVCLAGRAVSAQAALAAADGVDVREEVEVLALRPRDDGVAVDTAAGPIEARVAVVTPGAWAQHILDVPVTASLQTVAYFSSPDESTRLPTYIEWANDGFAWYAVPRQGDAPGMKAGEHRPGRTVDPRDGPFDADTPTLERTADFVRRRFPGLDPMPRAPEVCLYELTPDEHFILDREGPFVVGTGGSGHGFKFAPLLGEVLADLAEGRDPGLPPGKFSLSRFEPAADVAG
jgi:sarcosine oxidase